MNTDKSFVHVYDTTLRDGTQGEGISFPVGAKLELARRMDEFGFDYIEGGWPGSNPRDVAFFEQARSLHFKHAKLVAFGSTRRSGVPVGEDPQVAMLLAADTPAVTIFGKTWLLHVTEVMHTTGGENLAMIGDTVAHLRAAGREVIYDAEHFFDGYADNPEYALSTLEAALKGGASFLVLCDTNGGVMPAKMAEAVRTVKDRFPGTRVGVHCHNDCGMAVALSLLGVEAGACMVQGTLNGYGERTGNANLTTIVPNLVLKMGMTTTCAANLAQLRSLSNYADDLANVSPDSKQPYVGLSAFAHKGGVHANAAKKVARSYEHIAPELVGNRQRVLLSDMSGGSSVAMKARELGIELDEKSPHMKDFLALLKEREFQGYEYENADASLEVLIRRHFEKLGDVFRLRTYRVMTEVDRRTGEILSEASVKVTVNGKEYHTVAEANGPVGALDHAMRKALVNDFPFLEAVKLLDYKVRILDRGMGTDSIVRVLVLSGNGKQTWWTTGAGTNIIESSYEAVRDSLLYAIQLESNPRG
jgi:2-isopropylmalate synthase